VGSDNDNNNTESNDDKSNGNDNVESNANKPSNLAAATDLNDSKPNKNQGVQRLQRKGKGVTKKCANYSLLMAARQARRGGPHRALIHKGCVFSQRTQDYPQQLPRGDQGGKNIPCHGPPVHDEGPVSGKDVIEGTGNGIPLRDRSAPVSEHKGASRHSASHCLS
jgi:hypothetical protein